MRNVLPNNLRRGIFRPMVIFCERMHGGPDEERQRRLLCSVATLLSLLARLLTTSRQAAGVKQFVETL